MNLKELRSKSDKELLKKLDEMHDYLRVLKFKVAQRQLKKINEIKSTKKDIARILTILKERQLAK